MNPSPEDEAVASRRDKQTNLMMIMGAGIILFGGLAKMGLDLSDKRSRRHTSTQQEPEVEPLVIPGMQMPPEDNWTYHPPSR